MRTVAINWVNDEQIDVQVDGATVYSANHDGQGWDGMQAVIDVTTVLAARFDADLTTTGVPNL